MLNVFYRQIISKKSWLRRKRVNPYMCARVLVIVDKRRNQRNQVVLLLYYYYYSLV